MAALTRVTASPSSGQQSTSSTSVPEYKYSTPLPPGIASPDTVETRFGTLKFFDGVRNQASTEKIYDNLDFQRAVQAYLLALPVVNQMGNREAILSVGPVNTTVPIWENLVATRRWSAVRLSAEYRMTARCRHLSAGTKAA